MTYDNPNNINNLHKHKHDWQPNCGAALTVLGYRGDREQVLLLATYSRFQNYTVTLKPFSWLLITLIKKTHINWQKHTDERSPIAVKPPWLFWATRRSEVYDSGPHIVDLSFLLRCSMPGHKTWSTAMKIAQRNWKYIPRTDDPTVKPAWLFWVKRSSEVYDSRPQHLDTIFQNLHSNNHHMFTSTVMQMAPEN